MFADGENLLWSCRGGDHGELESAVGSVGGVWWFLINKGLGMPHAILRPNKEKVGH